ncbi:MAG: SH3 domain-containing protein [Anaerolineae bacterium]|jgi:hypothetical protein
MRNRTESKKTLTILWIVTGLVALVLALVTVRLAARATSQAVFGSTAYLAGRRNAIRLRESPDAAAPVTAILVRGSAVTILDTTVEGEQPWYLIQKGDTTPGWVSGEFLSQDPP